jgi:hypothetical protein
VYLTLPIAGAVAGRGLGGACPPMALTATPAAAGATFRKSRRAILFMDIPGE